MPCPQCGQPLEAYQPPDEGALESELYGEAEAQQSTLLGESVPAPVNPAIVATHAFDGLSQAVRDQLAARQASLSSEMAQARPTAQVPTPVPQVGQIAQLGQFDPAAPAGGGKGPNATRILDISANQDAIDALVAASDPVPAPVAAADQRTMALDVSSVDLGPLPSGPLAPPPGPAPTASGTGPRFDASAKASGRHTRIEGLAIADMPIGPPPPVVSPVETPPPVARVEPPPPLQPIGGPPPRGTLPPSVSGDPRRTSAMPAVSVGGPTPAGPVESVRVTSAAVPRRAGSKTPLIIALTVVVLGGGAAAAYFLTRGGTPAVPSGDGQTNGSGGAVASAAPSGKAADPLAAALGDAQAELPRAQGGEPLDDGIAFLVGGPEGLSTSFGGVPGLPSLTLPEPQIDRDQGGEWVKPLEALLKGNRGPDQSRLNLALDQGADARTAIRIAYSAHRAGFREFGLVVDRGGDGRGALPFSVQPSGAALPAGGAMVVSVGSISVKVDAQDANGTQLSDGVAVPHKDGTKPDLDAVVTRIETILAAQPGVKRALVYPNPEMTLEQLAGVVDRVSAKSGKRLFADVSLAIR
jgi:hypothetical protein